MVGGRGVRLAPGSVVRDADLYLALDAREDLRAGLREVQVFLASLVRPEWLEELHPGLFSARAGYPLRPVADRVIGMEQLWFLDLLLREDLNPSIDPVRGRPDPRRRPAARSPRILRDDPDRGLARPGRVPPARLARTELARVRRIRCSARSSSRSAREGQSLHEVERARSARVPAGRLDAGSRPASCRESAPESLTLPNGRSVRLAYESGRPPVLAARLQDLFGWTDTPRLARGRVAVLLHILGPNHRPVQITQDLRSFWTTTYHQVRKDLRSRYPKHAWPDDPLLNAHRVGAVGKDQRIGAADPVTDLSSSFRRTMLARSGRSFGGLMDFAWVRSESVGVPDAQESG